MAGKAKPKKAERKREKAIRKLARRQGEAGAGTARTLLPDTLAGVTVPKTLRQSGTALAEFATSDLGRAMIVAALTAAADTLLRHRPAGAQEGASQPGGETSVASTAKEAVQSAVAAAAGVVKDAARNALPAALMGEAPSSAETPRAAAKPDKDAKR